MRRLYALMGYATRPNEHGDTKAVSSLTVGFASSEAEAMGLAVMFGQKNCPPKDGWAQGNPGICLVEDGFIREAYANLPPPAPSSDRRPVDLPVDATSNGVSGEAVSAGSSTSTGSGGK